MNCTQLLNESIEFYSNNPRGIASDGDDCVYWNRKNNTKCAVGRCMNRASLNKYSSYGGPINDLCYPINNFDNLLKPRYRGIPLTFWSRLQQLHDNHMFWHQKNLGLTPEGKKFVSKLQSTIKENGWDK
jgi:hypothetical protein